MVRREFGGAFELVLIGGFSHVGFRVAAADADLSVVVGEFFGRTPGDRGDEDALAGGGAVADLGEEVVDLTFGGSDLDLPVKRVQNRQGTR